MTELTVSTRLSAPWSQELSLLLGPLSQGSEQSSVNICEKNGWMNGNGEHRWSGLLAVYRP